MKSAVLAILLAVPATSLAGTEECRDVSRGDIASLFDRWNTSLKTVDPDRVVSNYAKASVLLPTLSNKPRVTPEEKIDYFEHFLMKGPVGRIDRREIFLACNFAVDIGLYSFTFADGSTARARYSFDYAWNGRQWLIVAHHSSLMPEQE